jgi:radical SAM superfamily enzyme YgiQ (UPF0313 family)
VGRLKDLKHFCPHFNLSLQSGCTATLKRMRRRYTAEEYAAGVELLKEAFPDLSLTTDIIVGFPGETEEEFAETLAFAEKIGFSKSTYSPSLPAVALPRGICRMPWILPSKKNVAAVCWISLLDWRNNIGNDTWDVPSRSSLSKPRTTATWGRRPTFFR